MSTPPEVKYTRISKLPFRARLTLAALYIAALLPTLGAAVVSDLKGFGPGVTMAAALEIIMVIHLIRRA